MINGLKKNYESNLSVLTKCNKSWIHQKCEVQLNRYWKGNVQPYMLILEKEAENQWTKHLKTA